MGNFLTALQVMRLVDCGVSAVQCLLRVVVVVIIMIVVVVGKKIKIEA